jgi:hypothetical protein
VDQLADVVRHGRPAPDRKLAQRHLKKEEQDRREDEPGGGAADPVDDAIDPGGEADQRLSERGGDFRPLATTARS